MKSERYVAQKIGSQGGGKNHLVFFETRPFWRFIEDPSVPKIATAGPHCLEGQPSGPPARSVAVSGVAAIAREAAAEAGNVRLGKTKHRQDSTKNQ